MKTNECDDVMMVDDSSNVTKAYGNPDLDTCCDGFNGCFDSPDCTQQLQCAEQLKLCCGYAKEIAVMQNSWIVLCVRCQRWYPDEDLRQCVSDS